MHWAYHPITSTASDLFLEALGHNIVCIKRIDNTVADAISHLDYNPNKNIEDLNSHQWLGNMVKLLTHYIEENGGKRTQSSNSEALCLAHSVEDEMSILDIFANISKEEEIFPLTVSEIAREQRIHQFTKVYFSQGNTTRRKKTKKTDKRISLKIIDDTEVLVYDNYRLVIPGTDLQSRSVQWYHHYLQHPGHSRLEETLSAVMWWPNMHGHIRVHVKTCK